MDVRAKSFTPPKLQFLLCSGAMLVAITARLRRVLAPLWLNSGPILDPFWLSSGPILAPFWTYSGPILDPFWPVLKHFWTLPCPTELQDGLILDSSRPCCPIRPILAPFWTHSGPILAPFWPFPPPCKVLIVYVCPCCPHLSFALSIQSYIYLSLPLSSILSLSKGLCL
jgi:hypothetical protein